MTYVMKALSGDPSRIRGMSERMIISHYENNYGGAVKRLNLIEEKLAGVDFVNTPGFLINGLKREQLIAANSMILHEVFFDGLGDESDPDAGLKEALARDFGSYERWRAEFMAMGKALGGGSGWVLLTWSPRDRRLVNQWPRIAVTPSPAEHRFWRSTCTSTPITSITVPRPPAMWMSSWRQSIGASCGGPMQGFRNEARFTQCLVPDWPCGGTGHCDRSMRSRSVWMPSWLANRSNETTAGPA